MNPTKQEVTRARKFAADNLRKPSKRWVPINIDLQCWLALWTERRSGEYTPNDVIRRLVGLGPRRKA